MADWIGMEDIPTGAVEWNAIHNANRTLIAAKFQSQLGAEYTVLEASRTLAPGGADWPVAASAALETALGYSAIPAVNFDASTLEGRGLLIYAPPNASLLTITAWVKVAAQSAAKGLGFKWYTRPVTLDASMAAWLSFHLTSFPVTASLGFFQLMSQQYSLGQLSLTTNTLHQIELVRNISLADNPVGDMSMVALGVRFG
jgi:hypothetical protein